MDESRGELERIVARLLPGIVAQQLAAMSPPPVWDAVPGAPTAASPPNARQDKVPDWYRDAGAAAADYANEFALVEFDPEAPGVTSEMRRFHWTAADARDRALRILGDLGRRDTSKEVYAAIGRGREALIRLRALRAGLPVPLQLLTPGELTGAPDASKSTHTGERFHWAGTGSAEILLDRPEPARPVLIRADSRDRACAFRQMRRTEQVVEQIDENHVAGDRFRVFVATPTTTHLKITGEGAWSVRIIDPQRLPEFGDAARGSGNALYQYARGPANVVLQSLSHILVLFYRSDLTSERVAGFNGETRATIALPKGPGVLSILTTDRWSIDPAPERRKR